MSRPYDDRDAASHRLNDSRIDESRLNESRLNRTPDDADLHRAFDDAADNDFTAPPPHSLARVEPSPRDDANYDTHADARDEHHSVLTRIPEALGALGQNLRGTLERAMHTKDDYVVAVKVSPEAQDKLEQLVQAGVFRSRAEAASFLIDEGIKAQTPLFDRVQAKLAEIERLQAELRGLVNEDRPPT